MEKELTSAEKSRKTKLSKKSVEDLVNIIIRKDDVERRKDKLIACLKTNISGLENKVSSIQQNLQNVEKEYTELADKHQHKCILVNELQTDINYTKNELKVNKQLYKNKLDTLQEELRKAFISDTKCFVLGMFVGGIIFAIIHYII